MNDRHLLPKALRPSAWARAKLARLRLARACYTDRWFPHWPLGLGALTLAVYQLVPRIHEFIGFGLGAAEASGLTRSLLLSALHGVPQSVLGGTILVMSFGLLLRSRLAWTLSFLLLSANLVLWAHGTVTLGPHLVELNAALIVALLLARRRFDRSSMATGTLFGATSIILLLGYAVFGSLILGKGFSPPISNLDTALYFAVVTMSTVGYGDIVPHTDEARLFVVSLIALSISVLAATVSAMVVPAVTNLVDKRKSPQERTMSRSNHYIIVGDSPLARNTYRELRARAVPITVVLGPDGDPSCYPEADVVRGDAGQSSVLAEAGAAQALAVLALSHDDTDNAFTVLAMHELNPATRTVASVVEARNMERVRRVRPDILIAPEIMGGELLAMALSGEELEGAELIKRLFRAGSHESATTATAAAPPTPAPAEASEPEG